MAPRSIIELPQIRATVQGLCAATPFPAEICDTVADFLGPEHIFSLAYLSKRLNHVTNAAIYCNIEFDWGPDPSPSWNKQPAAHLLLRTLLMTPCLSQHIRSFKLMGAPLLWLHEVWYFQDEDRYHRLRDEPDLAQNSDLPKWNYFDMPEVGPFHSIAFNLSKYSEMERWRYEVSTAALVANNVTVSPAPAPHVDKRVLGLLLGHLRSLEHIRVDAGFFFCPYVRAELHRMLTGLSSPNFRTVDFFSNLGDDSRDQLYQCAIAAQKFCREVEVAPLALSNLEILRTPLNLDLELPCQPLQYPNLRTLSLFIPLLRKESSRFEKLLMATPNLESLKVDLNTGIDWLEDTYGQTFDPADFPLFTALWHVRHSLKHLRLDEHLHDVFRTPFNNTHARFARTSRRLDGVVDLTRLESLHLPAFWVIGSPEERMRFDPSAAVLPWHDLLPRSLRHITWTYRFELHYETRATDNDSIIRLLPSFLDWFASCRTGAEDMSFTLRYPLHHVPSLHCHMERAALKECDESYDIRFRIETATAFYAKLDLPTEIVEIFASTPGWEWPHAEGSVIHVYSIDNMPDI